MPSPLAVKEASSPLAVKEAPSPLAVKGGKFCEVIAEVLRGARAYTEVRDATKIGILLRINSQNLPL